MPTKSIHLVATLILAWTTAASALDYLYPSAFPAPVTANRLSLDIALGGFNDGYLPRGGIEFLTGETGSLMLFCENQEARTGYFTPYDREWTYANEHHAVLGMRLQESLSDDREMPATFVLQPSYRFDCRLLSLLLGGTTGFRAEQLQFELWFGLNVGYNIPRGDPENPTGDVLPEDIIVANLTVRPEIGMLASLEIVQDTGLYLTAETKFSYLIFSLSKKDTFSEAQKKHLFVWSLGPGVAFVTPWIDVELGVQFLALRLAGESALGRKPGLVRFHTGFGFYYF